MPSFAGTLRRDPAVALTVFALWALLALFVVYPLAALLARVLFDHGRFTASGIGAILTDRHQIRAFWNSLLLAAGVGIVGTLIGFALGVLFADNIETIRQWLQGLTGTELFSAEIYFLSQLPAIIEPEEVAAVVIMALALSLLATVYPSWRAARLDPVEALRYE